MGKIKFSSGLCNKRIKTFDVYGCCEQNSITLPLNSSSSCSWSYQYASRECLLLNFSFIYMGKTCQRDYSLCSKRMVSFFSISLSLSIFFFLIISITIDRKGYWGGNQLTCIHIISYLMRVLHLSSDAFASFQQHHE